MTQWSWIPWNLSFRYILFHEKRLQMMLWQHNARVNSHQRWKQTRLRVCFHLWCELTTTMNVTEWQLSWNSCAERITKNLQTLNMSLIFQARKHTPNNLEAMVCWFCVYQSRRLSQIIVAQKNKSKILSFFFSNCQLWKRNWLTKLPTKLADHYLERAENKIK